MPEHVLSDGSGAAPKARHPALWAAVIVLSLTLSARTATADEEPSPPLAATPYRPSISTPAALSAPGYLELEWGVEHQGAARPVGPRTSLPYTAKLAFSDDWGVRLSGEAWVRQGSDGQTSLNGGGDTSLVLKRRFAVNADNAFGLELGLNGATARASLGEDSSSTTLNGIFSSDFAPAWHTDLNLSLTRFRSSAPGVSRNQWAWVAALSRNLDERWGVVGELSGTRQAGTELSTLGLVALSYNVSPRLVLDVAAARSLRSGAPPWTLYTGLTWLGPKLF